MSESTQQEEQRIKEEEQQHTAEPSHEENVQPGSPGTTEEETEKKE